MTKSKKNGIIYINMIKAAYEKIKLFYETHERRIGIGLMFFGFGIDNLTLKRIDLLFENLFLAGYLVIALACILLINARHHPWMQHPWLQKTSVWASVPMQIVFGGLFSGYIVFYSRSASIIASWPFITMLILLMVGNELAKTRYARFSFQITVFYTAVFSFAIFFMPVMTKRMGAFIFFLSGIASLFVILLVLLLLRTLARERFEKSKYYFSTSIICVYALFNLLYFTNIIPPIPLALKNIGVYHAMSVKNAVYDARVEPAPWYQFYYDTSRVFHRVAGERVYVLSAVFAPTDLEVGVFHRWHRYDEMTRKWEAFDKISFSIVGGRDGGYRGFSYKQNVQPGRWRVDVVTGRNQLIGQIGFDVVESADPPRTIPVKL